MAIRRVTGPTVQPVSTPTTAAKPAAAAPSSPFSTSSFTAAATSSSSAHVESNNDDVNEYINSAVDAFNSSASLTDLDPNSAGGALRDYLGLKYMTRSAGQQVLTKVAAYVKEHPDASLKEVKDKMTNEAMTTGIVLKFIETQMDKLTQKKDNPFAEAE